MVHSPPQETHFQYLDVFDDEAVTVDAAPQLFAVQYFHVRDWKKWSTNYTIEKLHRFSLSLPKLIGPSIYHT